MTQGTRPDGQIFAAEANENELEEFPSIPRGWGVTLDGKDESGNTVTSATNGVPPMEWMNGILNKLSSQIVWNMQHAIPSWIAGNWDAGAFVTHAGWVYYNNTDTETADEPGTGSAWIQVMPLGNLSDLYLPLSGGAMTGPIGFKDGDPSRSYALNRQAVWSLMDCYNALPLMNSTWNKVGTVDTTVNQYGRVSFTLIGSMSHDVGMAVQTGFVNIDIIGVEGSNSPGITLTIFKPDEAKGTAIADAVLSASPTQDKCFDLWIKTQSAVAGIMPFGKQSTPGYLTFYSTFETTDVDPEPSTETGKIYLVSANKDGKVNIKGELKVAGKTTFNEEVYLEDKRIMIDEPNPGNVPDGTIINTEAFGFRMMGRGALGDPEGATAKMYYSENVGTNNLIVFHINGYGNDVFFNMTGDGGFSAPGPIYSGGDIHSAGSINSDGMLYEGGARVYSPNNPQPINFPQIVSDLQLGMQQQIDKEGDHSQMYQCPNGCVMTGTYVTDGDGKEAAYTTAYYKPIQKYINGTWITISG